MMIQMTEILQSLEFRATRPVPLGLCSVGPHYSCNECHLIVAVSRVDNEGNEWTGVVKCDITGGV